MPEPIAAEYLDETQALLRRYYTFAHQPLLDAEVRRAPRRIEALREAAAGGDQGAADWLALNSGLVSGCERMVDLVRADALAEGAARRASGIRR